MISVCIPIFNFNVTKLVDSLKLQAKNNKIPIEFILIDDNSEDEYKSSNSRIKNVEHYIELDENIGRSKIRNKFKAFSKYEYLLFLDCDSEIVSDAFLLNYAHSIKDNNGLNVICGGRIYNDKNTNRSVRLRWKYGKYNESQPLAVREKFPNSSFMTNNFIIKKNVFGLIKFDEKLSTYGHEDTVFGLELKSKQIEVHHIDNFIIDQYLESNEEYLKKVKESILNLVFISRNYDNDFLNDIRLLRSYLLLKKFNIIFLVKIYHFIFSNLSFFLLKKGFVNLKMFSLYKLGLFIKLAK